MTSTQAPAGSAAQDLAALLVPGSRVCLTTHINPDGDGLGSEVALVHLLRARGIDAVICNPSPTPERFGFLFEDLPGVDRSAKAVVELRRADLIIVLDIAEISRLGGLATTVEERGVPVACLDHHVGPGHLPEGPRYIDPTAAATGELLHRLAVELDWEITPAVARALYVALVTDTGSFRFANTSPATLRTAAHLIECGADPEQVYRDVYASGPIGRPRLLAETLQTLVHEPEIGLTWLTVPTGALERHGVASDDLDGVVEHARAVAGVRIALLFREVSAGRVKVSFRSVGDVDVAALARQFGGGGHTKASGAAIVGTLDEVQSAVLAAARAALATDTPT
ncbi:MAG: bifunctional oligoribonuclease/PAP phosphatase NrnA [Gemmatimonadetes bacterium]|nr:bifunctional oligoribonuclease/PAP phosphatase NrnA [Gemmatimonadota bacterium]MCA9768957.1 bifunctional oligoribonuclease/PAP phosphatase NrnA [Gemmatimonadota bacterium]MCB9518376.1 bifunctional oligoribonuclease/PAP phosphatase NrnA [Gemmatimonadales bacterium]HPF61801.1 bifunctional oligoribonuclease/PAP phosphatase NrnA [Gemmatimonadales bacterium]HRX17986.1 bifunctional oligoribonuclease/PAP phosphatase NrnA [Gemmatimonadales bacterium]